MKKLNMVLLGLFISVCFTSGVFSSDEMKLTVKKTSILVPTGWSVEYSNSTTVYILYAPQAEESNFHENMNLVTEELPKKYSVKDYLSAAKGQLGTVFQNLKMVEEKANYHIFTATYNGVNLQEVQFVFIKNKTAYVVTGASTPEKFEEYRKIFFEIAKTFKIE